MAKRERTLRVRMDDDEWQALEEKANEASLTMSELVRTSIGKLQVRNRKDQRERTIVLNRLNANLNMIEKWCNTYKSNADRVEVISHLIAIEQEIKPR